MDGFFLRHSHSLPCVFFLSATHDVIDYKTRQDIFSATSYFFTFLVLRLKLDSTFRHDVMLELLLKMILIRP